LHISYLDSEGISGLLLQRYCQQW